MRVPRSVSSRRIASARETARSRSAPSRPQTRPRTARRTSSLSVAAERIWRTSLPAERTVISSPGARVFSISSARSFASPRRVLPAVSVCMLPERSKISTVRPAAPEERFGCMRARANSSIARNWTGRSRFFRRRRSGLFAAWSRRAVCQRKVLGTCFGVYFRRSR